MIFKRRAVIGVTGPDKGGHAAWFFTWLNVFIAGGNAVRITPTKHHDDIQLDALVIGGGADIEPSRYGDLDNQVTELKKDLHKEKFRIITWLFYPFLLIFRSLLGSSQTSRIDSQRDELEFKLLDQSIQKDIPVLGICRGAQLINVYFGGTLYRNINEFYTESINTWSIFPGKTITVKPGTMLSKCLGLTGQCIVNALHKQAVKETGKGVCVTATENNGIIQAIEVENYFCVIGVQWHPEYLINHKTQRRLFRSLVQLADESRDRRND